LAALSGTTLPQAPPTPPPAAHHGKSVPVLPKAFEQQWTIPLDAAERVALAGGAASFFLSSEHGPLVARALDDGHVLWSFDAGADVRVATSDDLIFVPHGETLDAVEQATGHKRWTAAIDPLAVAPTFRDGWVFAGTKKGSIIALRADDGSLVWDRPLGSPVVSTVAVDGNQVFAALADKRLVALRVEDSGSLAWTNDELEAVGGEILAVADRLYVGHAGGVFFSIRQDNGRNDWVHELIRSRIVGRAVADDVHVYVVTGDNRAIALDRSSGTIRWKNVLLARPGEALMLESKQLIVPLASGGITIFDAEGKQIANIDPPAATEGVSMVPPVVLAGPPDKPQLIRVTMGADQVQTVTSYKRKTG
jgi:outer membrane protein assembly factor BamB